jgi:hypothetical protein
LSWEELGYPSFNLNGLDAEITGEEVQSAVTSIPKDNAPGPDGFIGSFYHKCWDIVKSDVIAVVQQLSQLRGETFTLLNTANIVLLPKKEQAAYSIFSKVLANRLAPQLPKMVSSGQSAFVKRRCIYDNFVLVQSLVKEFHRRKTKALFIKLDIVKAFNSVSWAYLLEVLQRLGFNTKWRDWIRLALSTTSSRVLLNGIPRKPLKHEIGLRQGDPILPMLFNLAMDPLQHILHLATEKGVLHPILSRAGGIKTSLYTDDAAIFISPTKQNVQALQSILDIFGQALGLCTNIQKPEVYPIGCS